MANKEKKKINIYDVQFLFLSFLIVIYFFYGFFTNENSAGAGGYNGDFKLIWSNLLLLKEGLLTNISNPEYSDSRSPLSYILHILFNPFIDNEQEFRNSTFIISLIVPSANSNSSFLTPFSFTCFGNKYLFAIFIFSSSV